MRHLFVICADIFVFDENATEGEFESHISALLGAANPRLSHSSIVRVINRDLYQALMTAGLFPLEGQIQRTIDRLGLSRVYSGSDLVRYAYRLLEQNVLEEELSIADALYSSWNRPTASSLLWREKYGLGIDEQLGRSICLCFLHAQANGKAANTKLLGKSAVLEEHSISCDVVDSNDPRIDAVPLPVLLQGEVRMKNSDAEAWTEIAAEDLWSASKTESDLESAIITKYREITGNVAFASFSVGRYFLESLRPWQASGVQPFARTVLNCCARMLDGGSNLHEAKPFTKNGQGLLRSDGARGMRAHLTKQGVGLRLHFWICANGAIEFVNVGGKMELHFPL